MDDDDYKLEGSVAVNSILLSRKVSRLIIIEGYKSKNINGYEAVRLLFNLGYRGKDLVLK